MLRSSALLVGPRCSSGRGHRPLTPAAAAAAQLRPPARSCHAHINRIDRAADTLFISSATLQSFTSGWPAAAGRVWPLLLRCGSTARLHACMHACGFATRRCMQRACTPAPKPCSLRLRAARCRFHPQSPAAQTRRRWPSTRASSTRTCSSSRSLAQQRQQRRRRGAWCRARAIKCRRPGREVAWAVVACCCVLSAKFLHATEICTATQP